MKHWSFGFDLTQWALPLFARWIVSDNLRLVGVYILCFSVIYERWAHE